MQQVSLGIVGCGTISDVYFEAEDRFNILRVGACADIVPEKAKEKAEEYGVPTYGGITDVLDDPEIDIVVNLTPPSVHSEVLLQSIEAGKNVYTEKPLAVSAEQGTEILSRAAENGVAVGVAPDTFLGGGIQTCRNVIDSGQIGEPVGATAIWASSGHEHWHPSPELYYKDGGGPLFDMGPYYLTALVFLMGSVESVSGTTRQTFSQRTITSQPKSGTMIDVEVPTHESATLEFESGAIGTLLMSFDVSETDLSGAFEVYGTKGTLRVPDPNQFGGPVTVHRDDMADGEWETVPITHGHTDENRGIGVADMAYSIRTDWEQRADGELGCHILEIMDGIREASASHAYVDLSQSCEQPNPLPADFPTKLSD